MPATPTADVRKPSAPAASRLLADYPALGIVRAQRAGAIGFMVKNVAKDQDQHGGPVIALWNQPDRAPGEARLLSRGRQTLMRQLLEEAGFAVAVHHGGYLVLLTPEDAEAHREAERAAGLLLGAGSEFRRRESDAPLDDARETRVARMDAVAEVALALRTGRAPYGQAGAVVIEGVITVSLEPVAGEEAGETRRETPLREARRVFGQMGETVLDDRDAVKGTGVWVRRSMVPGEVLVQRKDDGRAAAGFSAAARRWETFMDFYRRLLENEGWVMTGRGEMGWGFLRPSLDDALTRAEKVLGALWPQHRAGERCGWVTGRHEGEHWQVRWRSELPDDERRAVAEVAMLPYLADALRRVGLSTTMPDELPHLEDQPPYAPSVYFAEPPADRSGERYQTGWLREGWTMDTHTGCFRRKAADEERAESLARFDNREEETNRRLGRVSRGLPGLTSDLAEVPEFRAVAAELAAAGYMPAHRWEDHDRPWDGFTMCLDQMGIQVNHLTTQPDGGHRITRPVDEDQATVFEAMLLAYVEVLDAPGRIVTLKSDHLVVFGVEERHASREIPDGQLFDAAVTYRVDHGAPRTAVYTLSPRAVDPHGDGEPLRHRVAQAVAVGRDVDRIVIDDVHPFEEIGTEQHRAQEKAARMLIKVLGAAAVWRVSIDPLRKANPGVRRSPGWEGVLLLAVPDDAPKWHVRRVREAAAELGWSPAVLSPSVVWVTVPTGGDAVV
ncbi:hypothetical protein AB0O47_32540 [Streptomyces noursei]|uniref:hypothetical protein n=1 Tax=Streptomyces noursei TaxID=1971 RepID=UPI0034507500